MGIIVKLLLLVAGGLTAREVFRGSGAGGIKPAVFGVYIPTDAEPGATRTELGGEEEIAPVGEVIDFALVELDPAQSDELIVDVKLTVYHAQGSASNNFYGAGRKQWCEGLRLRADATRTATGVQLAEQTQESNALICAEGVEPGQEQNVLPFPNDEVRPHAELVATATGVVLRVQAPALKFSKLYAEPGKGYPPSWWAQVGPWRYTLRLHGSLQVKAK